VAYPSLRARLARTPFARLLRAPYLWRRFARIGCLSAPVVAALLAAAVLGAAPAQIPQQLSLRDQALRTARDDYNRALAAVKRQELAEEALDAQNVEKIKNVPRQRFIKSADLEREDERHKAVIDALLAKEAALGRDVDAKLAAIAAQYPAPIGGSATSGGQEPSAPAPFSLNAEQNQINGVGSPGGGPGPSYPSPCRLGGVDTNVISPPQAPAPPRVRYGYAWAYVTDAGARPIIGPNGSEARQDICLLMTGVPWEPTSIALPVVNGAYRCYTTARGVVRGNEVVVTALVGPQAVTNYPNPGYRMAGGDERLVRLRKPIRVRLFPAPGPGWPCPWTGIAPPRSSSSSGIQGVCSAILQEESAISEQMISAPSWEASQAIERRLAAIRPQTMNCRRAMNGPGPLPNGGPPVASGYGQVTPYVEQPPHVAPGGQGCLAHGARC
jgi:hypothetical protein